MPSFMARTIVVLLLIASACYEFADGSFTAARGQQDDQQTVLEADRALTSAFERADRAALSKLLDADFTWISTDGRFQSREDVVQLLPKPLIGNDGAKTLQRTYGNVALVAIDRDRSHVLHVWVKRPAGWRALHFNEIIHSRPRRPTATLPCLAKPAS